MGFLFGKTGVCITTEHSLRLTKKLLYFKKLSLNNKPYKSFKNQNY